MTTEPSRTEIAEVMNRALILELRREGYDVPFIAAKVGIPPIRVMTEIRLAIEELHGDSRKFATEIREIELQRLDMATLAVMPKVEAGSVAAIDSLLKIQQRRAKFLGLDSPTQVEQQSEVRVIVDWAGSDRLSYRNVTDVTPVPPTPVEWKEPADTEASQLARFTEAEVERLRGKDR